MVAETDGAARLLAALVDLDADATYSKSTLATRADVPRKTLFVAETLETLADVGLLRRVSDADGDTEARYRIVDDHPLYEAACAFDEAATAAADVPTVEAE